MLIFRESGRLGNQLFQYAALSSSCKQPENLVLLGFQDLQTIFDGINAKIINSNNSRLERTTYRHFYEIAQSLSQRGIFARIFEAKESVSPKLEYKPGFFKKIVFVEESYFQNETFFNQKSISSLKIKKAILESSKRILSSLKEFGIPVFVHIRRGDYLSWPTQKSPAVLPAAYYQNCINIIQSEIPDAFFIFLSDDILYAKDIFGGMKNTYFSNGSSLEDFSLMTQCHSGILSASSFSWWAAYLSNLQHPGATFLAPNYWCGHSSNSWYPPFIESSFLQYVDVWDNF